MEVEQSLNWIKCLQDFQITFPLFSKSNLDHVETVQLLLNLCKS